MRRPGMMATAAALTAFLFAGADLSAQQTAIYSARDLVHPVFGENGMVASQEAVATEVGLEVLKKGGNAVDAAVSVAFALAVTLPRAGNLGGGGFMMVHDAESGDTVAIDYREMSGEAAFRDMYLDEDGEADSNKSRFSGLAVGVPGTVAGMAYALERYGTISLADALQPAIRLAEEGIEVTGALSDSLKALSKRLQKWPSSTAVFYKEGGAAFEPGEVLVQSDLAETMKLIADGGADAFYEGPIAEKIVDAVEAADGHLTLDDFKSYEVKLREPIKGTYRGHEIVSMPPPSSGGVHIVQILNTLEGVPIGFLGHNSADSIHMMAEAMKFAYADRSEYLGDPDFVDVPIGELTSKAYAADILGRISQGRAATAAEIAPGDLAPYESNETTHFPSSMQKAMLSPIPTPSISAMAAVWSPTAPAFC